MPTEPLYMNNLLPQRGGEGLYDALFREIIKPYSLLASSLKRVFERAKDKIESNISLPGRRGHFT